MKRDEEDHEQDQEQEDLMTAALAMFLGFVLITLGITYWAARRSRGDVAYFAAGRRITAWQNGLAVAGDYMSAASFLGIAGMIAFNGYDGFMYSVGWLVAYLTVLLIVAEPLRNAGKYTMADLLAYRLKARPVRAVASLSTLTVSTFYMIAQMVGAGALVKLLLPGVNYETAVIGVGILMIVYVVFGGMLATTWVQIIKAVLLMSGSIFLSILVMKHFGFSFSAFFEAISQRELDRRRRRGDHAQFFPAGLLFKPPWGAIDLISLGLALIFGTAGLPHILVRFYTVPDARTARHSVVWAMVIIGAFLHHDDVSWLRRGDDPYAGQYQHRKYERAAAGEGARRRSFLRFYQCGRVCHDPRGRRRPDDQCEHQLRSRFLHECDPPRAGAAPGEEVRVARDHGLRGGRGCDPARDQAADCQCGFSGGARLRGRGERESAGDRAAVFSGAASTRPARWPACWSGSPAPSS